MNLAVAGINHQPLKIRLVYRRRKNFFPDSFIAPSQKTPVYIAPVSIVRWQVTPWRSCTENPENCIYKQTVIFCYSTPAALLSRKQGFKPVPDSGGYVMSSVGWHDYNESPFLHMLAYKIYLNNLVTTASRAIFHLLFRKTGPFHSLRLRSRACRRLMRLAKYGSCSSR